MTEQNLSSSLKRDTNIYNNDSELSDFVIYMENKSIWRDLHEKEQIINGAEIKPISTLSTYRHWIKNNILFANDNEILFISGSNLVRYNLFNGRMHMYSIKNNCEVVSFSCENNIQGQTIVTIGMKTKTIDSSYSTEPIIEIIHINKNNDNITLDLSNYNNTNYVITEAKTLPDSDLCICLLKDYSSYFSKDHISSHHKDELNKKSNQRPKNKISLWEFPSYSFLQQIELEDGIEKIISINFHEFILYGKAIAEQWVYLNLKKKINLNKRIIKTDENEITSICYMHKMKYLLIAYNDFKIGVYDSEFNILSQYDVKSKIDFGSSFNQIILNFNISIRNLLTNENLIICFIQETKEMLIIEISESNQLELKSKIRLDVTFNSRSKVISNNSFSNFIYINAEAAASKFSMIKNKSKKNKNKEFEIPSVKISYYLYRFNINQANDLSYIKFHELEKENNKSKTNSIVGLSNMNLSQNRNEKEENFEKNLKSNSISLTKAKPSKRQIKSIKTPSEMSSFTPNKSISSYVNIDLASHSQCKDLNNQASILNILQLEKEIFPHSCLGCGVKLLAISNNPKVIIVIYENRMKFIYKIHQFENNNRTLSISSTPHSKENKSIDDDISFNYELISEMKLENDPICLDISPYGNTYIISFPDYTYIYGILNKEIKEYVKINSFCKAVAFSKSGRYIAYSRSQFINSVYSIVIIDSSTYEIEYIISNLSHFASEIQFLSNDSVIVFCLEDNNIFGWRLGSKREMIQNQLFKDKENSKIKQGKDDNLLIKILDLTDKIIGFAYDISLDMLVVILDDKKVRVMLGSKEDKFYEFLSPEKYTCVLLIKPLDIILFGTENGYIHCYIWPFSRFAKNYIETPYFISLKIHMSRVNYIKTSSNYQYLFTTSEDGSFIISQLTSFIDSELYSTSLPNFNSFDMVNLLPTKIFIDNTYYTNITESIIQEKVNKITNLKSEIIGKVNELTSKVNKANVENSKKLQVKRNEINEEIEKQRVLVKELEEKKEYLSKSIKENRDSQLSQFKDEIEEMKSKYKNEKDELHEKTRNLSHLLKEITKVYKDEEEYLKISQKKINSKIEGNYERMIDYLKEKEKQIEAFIDKKVNSYKNELVSIEEEYEKKLREIEQKSKKDIDNDQVEIDEYEKIIKNMKKKIKDDKEKIEEWEKNKNELDMNNIELQENLAANTVRLKNMTLLLSDNEKNITEQEKIVKSKREINARLEKLRYVLEYQITNLIKEKTPIEDQIKNFEELHNDFYNKFNQLYAEQLNIEECINENKGLIEDYKKKLFEKKTNLYLLKNLYNSLNLKIGFIFKDNINDKYSILSSLENIYKEDLEGLEGFDFKSEPSNENKVQNKILEKEIKKHKNKVLTDLINKRKEIKLMKKEKAELMLSIQKENTLFIEQCTSIRLNLNDILKNINDIEKKFIELTNTHSYLNKDNNTKNIKDNLKQAVKTILLADSEVNSTRKHETNKKKINNLNIKPKEISQNDFIHKQIMKNYINFNEFGEVNINEEALKSFEFKKTNEIEKKVNKDEVLNGKVVELKFKNEANKKNLIRKKSEECEFYY